MTKDTKDWLLGTSLGVTMCLIVKFIVEALWS